MIENMISKIIELETLTPLFIKGKEEKYGEGFIRIGNTIFLINNDKLCEFIYKNTYNDKGIKFANRPDYVEWYSYFISRKQNQDIVTHYSEFAKAFGLEEIYEEKKIPEGYKEKSIQFFLSETRLFQGNDESKNRLLIESGIGKGITRLEPCNRNGNRFTQNGNSRNYIPGSSLKGSIRNAILWKILSEHSKQVWLQSFIKYHLSVVDVLSKVSDLINKGEFQQAQILINQNEVLSQAHLINGNRIDKDKISELKKKYAEFFSDNQDSEQKTIKSVSFTENTPNISMSDSFDPEYNEYLKSHNIRWSDANNTLRDFFRLVKVSDANFVQDCDLKVKTAKAVCKDTSGTPQRNQTYQKNFDIKLECVPKAIKARFKLSIDSELAKLFFPGGVPPYLQDIDELLSVLNGFFRAVAKFEVSDYYDGATSIPADIHSEDKRKIKMMVNTSNILHLYKTTFGLQSDEILFRTGWGGGYMSKTQFLHLENADRVRVRDMIHPNGSSIAPKSRCLIVEGQNATEPLGWCQLRVLGDAKDIPLPSIDMATIKTELITQQNKQNAKGNNINSGKPLTEREVQKSNTTAKAILKQAEKKNTNATQVTYKAGQTVYATVEECVPFLSLKVIIGDQVLIINKGVIKQKGETVQIQITKVENGKILAVKLL
jgi:CRISPR type III-A-associated RAMP protein Csm5